MMFEFLFDYGNYDDRCVGRWDSKDGRRLVSTARVSDGRKPYETAFQHPDYNKGKMVIVEAYDSKESASAGHAKWVKIMTKGPLPKALTDCCNAGVAQLRDAFTPEDEKDWNVHKRRVRRKRV
jgi:hypothetical protein